MLFYNLSVPKPRWTRTDLVKVSQGNWKNWKNTWNVRVWSGRHQPSTTSAAHGGHNNGCYQDEPVDDQEKPQLARLIGDRK